MLNNGTVISHQDLNTDSYSGFAQATWHATDRLDLRVPVSPEVCPPFGDVTLGLLRVCMQRVGLSLGGLPGVLHLLFEVDLRLCLGGRRAVLDLLGSSGELRELVERQWFDD